MIDDKWHKWHKWHYRFLKLAKEIASWSKDPSRQVGCVLIGSDKEPISFGFNGFPRQINDDIASRYERPQKYSWMQHAEQNAISNAARMGVSIKGATAYTTLYPCPSCAGALIQSGITCIVTHEPNWEDPNFNFEISREMFEELLIPVIILEESNGV